MARPDKGSDAMGGRKTPGRKQDRLLINNALRDVRSRGGDVLTPRQVHRIAKVVSRTHKKNNFNAKDLNRLVKFLKAAENNKPYLFGDTKGRKPMGVGDMTKGYGENVQSGLNRLKKFSQKEDGVSPNSNKPGYGQGLGVLAPGVAPGTKASNSNDGKKGRGKNRPAPGKGGKGGKGGGGNNHGTEAIMQYFGPDEFNAPRRKEAALAVGQDINKLVREYLQQGQAMKSGMQFDIGKTNALFNRTEGDLKHIFGETQDYNRAQSNIIDQRYDATENQLGSLFKGLQGTMQGNTDTNRDAAMAEMARLGIQQTGMGNFDQDATWQSNMAGQNQANALANLQAQQNASAEVGNLLQSMSQASLQSAVGRATNDRNDMIADTRQEYRGNMNDILSQIRGVQKERHGMTNELHEAMTQNAYQQYAEGNQMEFNNVLATNAFNLDVAKHNSDNLLAKAKLRQEAQRQAALRRNQNRQWQQMQQSNKQNDVSMAELFNLS